MIPAIIRVSIANRVIVLALAVMMAVAGIWAIRETPVDAIPDLSDVQVIVKTPYPGQAPQVVATLSEFTDDRGSSVGNSRWAV